MKGGGKMAGSAEDVEGADDGGRCWERLVYKMAEGAEGVEGAEDCGRCWER